MEIKDMGELDLEKAKKVAEEIRELFKNTEPKSESSTAGTTESDDEPAKTKWVCPLCGYIHYSDTPPEKCPLCGAPGNTFTKES